MIGLEAIYIIRDNDSVITALEGNFLISVVEMSWKLKTDWYGDHVTGSRHTHQVKSSLLLIKILSVAVAHYPHAL